MSQPELLVEQLLMCTRVSTLELVLQGLWGRISTLPPGAPLSPPSLDALLRRYAAKAVDVQVRVRDLAARRQPTPTTPTKFTPSDVPPTKEEWVGNDEVRNGFWYSLVLITKSLFFQISFIQNCLVYQHQFRGNRFLDPFLIKFQT